MEGAAHPAKTLGAVDQDRLRRLEFGTRGEAPAEPWGIQPGLHPCRGVLVDLDLGSEATRIDQRYAAHFAVLLASLGSEQGQEGVLLVGAGAAPAFDRLQARSQWCDLHLALTRPGT
jgi:hypothetical protein